MLPALQPTRPKLNPTNQPPAVGYAQQQKRSLNQSQTPAPSQPAPTRATSTTTAHPPLEAMPPFVQGPQPQGPFYDAAVRHPVFFGAQLRKPPFPMPAMPAAASQGFSPVATGYVVESRRVEGNGVVRTKL